MNQQHSAESANFWLQPRTIVAYAVSLLALAEIIDLTIVAVAIPQIMGAIGANLDSIALVSTSYIVAAAVFILLSGLVVRKYGMKNVILVSGATFAFASIMCGLSTSLTEMVLFRIIQGIGGAFLPSVAQSYIASKFKGTEQTRMMTIFSLIVVMGPILGPVLGGFLSYNFNWRWIFYVNVPICALAISIILVMMPKDEGESLEIDYTSFFFMAVGVGLLEYFIDEGNRNGWLSSLPMLIIFCTSLTLLGFFIWRGKLGYSVISFHLFRNYNFVLSCATMFVFMVMVVGSMAYFPTMMQKVYGYPINMAGYITAPRGITALLAAPVLPRLIKRFGARKVLFCGMLTFSGGCFMLSSYGPSVSPEYVIASMILQGAGMMAFFIPMMQVVFVGIAERDNSEASGIFNFCRNFASSVGTSICATLVSHQTQVNYQTLGEHISPYNEEFQRWSQQLGNPPHPLDIAIANTQVLEQASLISYLDAFHFFAIAILFILWIPYLMRKPPDDTDSPPGMH